LREIEIVNCPTDLSKLEWVIPVSNPTDNNPYLILSSSNSSLDEMAIIESLNENAGSITLPHMVYDEDKNVFIKNGPIIETESDIIFEITSPPKSNRECNVIYTPGESGDFLYHTAFGITYY